MTKGGKLACEGTTLQIKNDHGKNFHIDLTFNSDFVIEEEIDFSNIEMIE